MLFAVPSGSRLGKVLGRAGWHVRAFITTTLVILGSTSVGFASLIVADTEPGFGPWTASIAACLMVALVQGMGALVWSRHRLLHALSADVEEELREGRPSSRWEMPDIDLDDYRASPTRPLRSSGVSPRR